MTAEKAIIICQNKSKYNFNTVKQAELIVKNFIEEKLVWLKSTI